MTTTTVEPGKKSNKGIWIGLGLAALFCLCSVGVAIFVFTRLGQRVREEVKTDPGGAAEAARAIADYDLPPGYHEEMGMNLFFYSVVMIAPDSSDKPLIMLAQFQAGANQQQMEEQIRRSFEQQSGRPGVAMKVVETKQMTIRGEDVEVVIYEGGDETGNVMRQLITTFPGKGGTAMLIVMGDAEDWDQEEIDTFIESIK